MHSAQRCIDRTLLNFCDLFETQIVLPHDKHFFLFRGQFVEQLFKLFAQFLFRQRRNRRIIAADLIRQFAVFGYSADLGAALFAPEMFQNLIAGYAEDPCGKFTVILINRQLIENFYP